MNIERLKLFTCGLSFRIVHDVHTRKVNNTLATIMYTIHLHRVARFTCTMD